VPRGVATAKQLAMMNKVLDSYCRTYNVSDAERREDLAALILELFDAGSRDEETLLAKLIELRA